MGGRTAVDVGYSDLDNISVTLQPAIDVAGSVTVEGRPEGLPATRTPPLPARTSGLVVAESVSVVRLLQ